MTYRVLARKVVALVRARIRVPNEDLPIRS